MARFSDDQSSSAHKRSESTSSATNPGRRSYEQNRPYVPTVAALSRQNSLEAETANQGGQGQIGRVPRKLQRIEDSPTLMSPPGVYIVENSPPPMFPREIQEKVYYPHYQKTYGGGRNSIGQEQREEQYFPHGDPFADPPSLRSSRVQPAEQHQQRQQPRQTHTQPQPQPQTQLRRQSSQILYSTPEIDKELTDEESSSSESKYLTPSEIRTRKFITRTRFFLLLLSAIFSACVCIGIGSVISEYRSLRSSNPATREDFASLDSGDMSQLLASTPNPSSLSDDVDESHTNIHLAIGIITFLITAGMFILSALWSKIRHINPSAIYTNLFVSLTTIGLSIGAMICCMEHPGQRMTMKQWICKEKQDLLCGEISISFIMSTVVLVVECFVLGNLGWSFVFMRKIVRAKAKWEAGRRMRRGFEGGRGGLGGNVRIGGGSAGEEKERLRVVLEEGAERRLVIGEDEEQGRALGSRFSPDTASYKGSPELTRGQVGR